MREKIIEMLLSTKRENMDKLIDWMDNNGFFTAPCSGSYHLAYEGGLAEHSLNVCELSLKLMNTLWLDGLETKGVSINSVIIAALLHDLGKTGQFGKPNYVPNMIKGRATKANPDPKPYQSDKKPYVTNPELLAVDHEIRSIQIIAQFIELTEDESFAILNHNGMYSNLRYAYSGRETPLNLMNKKGKSQKRGIQQGQVRSTKAKSFQNRRNNQRNWRGKGYRIYKATGYQSNT